jgi:hypothetical protein
LDASNSFLRLLNCLKLRFRFHDLHVGAQIGELVANFFD